RQLVLQFGDLAIAQRLLLALCSAALLELGHSALQLRCVHVLRLYLRARVVQLALDRFRFAGRTAARGRPCPHRTSNHDDREGKEPEHGRILHCVLQCLSGASSKDSPSPAVPRSAPHSTPRPCGCCLKRSTGPARADARCPRGCVRRKPRPCRTHAPPVSDSRRACAGPPPPRPAPSPATRSLR